MIHVVDLFAGIGGFAVGLRRTADELDLTIEHTAAVDLDGDALELFAVNHSLHTKHTYTCDVAEWINAIHDGSTPAPACDLIVGGPPCQGHSIANIKTRTNDPRNENYRLMADAAIALNARAVVIENVPGVAQDQHQVVTQTEQTLLAHGYHVTIGVLRADRMGAPQKRRRHFLIGRRDKWPVPITDLELRYAGTPMNAGELLQQPVTDDPTMNSYRTVGGKELARVNYLHDHDVYDLPAHLMPRAAALGKAKGFKHVYGRIRPWKPMPTVTATGVGPTHGRWVHPTERRVVTPAEKAATQEFPVDYQWRTDHVKPSRTQLTRWIGNAIPASLAHAVTWAAIE